MFSFLSFAIFCILQFEGNRTRVLILGANDLARNIVKESIKKKFRGYEIVGIASAQEKKLSNDIYGIKVSRIKDKIEETIRDLFC